MGKDSQTRCTDCVCVDPSEVAKSSGISKPLPGDCTAECAENKWVGDDLCDDGNNNCGCNWDGGDCCGPFSEDDYCTDCRCLDPDSLYQGVTCSQKCASSASQGDGFCDDNNNVCGCDWDGGDCCGIDKNVDSCKYCLCLDPASNDSKDTG